MGRCRRHPHHLVVGVCAYCLNEHLSAKLQGYEDPTSNFPSASAFTSSNPAPLATRRVRMRNSHMIDDIASSSHFSLPLSPQCRLESHYSTTSSSPSPQNQICFGNPDFIKEEIPARQSKSSFWSFLHCGHHEYGLEDVREEHIYDDDGIQVHGERMPSMSQMRAQREKGRRDRHGLPRMLFSSMPEFQAGSSCREVYVSLPHTALSPKQACRQRLSPSKQEYFHYPSSINLYTIRRSPLRRERHGDEEGFSEGLHGNHSWHAHNMGDYAHGSERHIDDREKPLGGRSSWKSWLFPQKVRRSKSITGLNGVGTYSASSDAEPTMARSVSVADQAYGSPRFSVSWRSRNVDNYQSPNMHMHMHSKSPESSFFHGYFGKGSSHASAYASYTNDANRPRDFLSFAAYSHSSPPSVESPISSLPRCNPNLRFLEDSFTMHFHDECRRSPMQAAVPAVAHEKTKRAEHHGNQDMDSYWSWSKALIRKTLAKKQGDDPIHHGMHEYNARKQSPLIHAYMDLALCSNGPPQHYSFLSRASYR